MAAAIKVVSSSRVLIDISSILFLFLSQVRSFDGNEPEELKVCGFDTIYNFGDSLSDTGNGAYLTTVGLQSNPPNVETVTKPTVRSSDGWLVLDYIANSVGFPFNSVKACLGLDETLDTRNVVNFAVTGATALSPNVILPKLNLRTGYVNNSLTEQLQWFGEYRKGLCQTECKEKIKSSLFVIGIGANDYGQAIFDSKKTIEEVKEMGLVSDVIGTITKGIESLVNYGATRVLVPGLYPFGCAPVFLIVLPKSFTHDEHGCLKDFNEFFKYHNDHLQVELTNLQKKYPDVSIVCGDYYNALQNILDNLQKFGFETITDMCCGDVLIRCGQLGSKSCSEPQKHVFWDFIHPTESTNKHVADWLSKDILTNFECCGA